MKFDISTERSEEFKIYFAKKLTEATGKIYESEDIFICTNNKYECSLDTNDKYKYIFANLLLFEKYNKKVLTDVEYVYGNVLVSGEKLTSLGSLTHIKGCFTSSYTLKDLGNLNTIGGNAEFYGATKVDLKNLKIIGGDADFSSSEIDSLKRLRCIGGHADFADSCIKDLGDLKIIGGDAIFNNSLVNDLKNLEYVGRNFFVSLNEDLENLGKLKYIGGGLEVNDRLKSLSNLEYVGGNFSVLFELNDIVAEVEDLGNLKVVEGYMNLANCKSLSSLNDLEYVGGYLDVSRTQVTTLGNVEYVGGDLYLAKSEVTDLGNLQYVGGEIYLNDSQKELFKDSIEEKNGKYYFKNNSSYRKYSCETNYKEKFEDTLKEENEFYRE